jgi:hypothetical protein
VDSGVGVGGGVGLSGGGFCGGGCWGMAPCTFLGEVFGSSFLERPYLPARSR